MSTAINPTHTSVPASSRASTIAANHAHPDSPYTNGYHHHHHDAGSSQQSSSANATKKGKQKKATDPNEASKLIAAKISQLETDAAGEKDQEAEIGWFCPFDFVGCKHIRRMMGSVFIARFQKFGCCILLSKSSLSLEFTILYFLPFPTRPALLFM